MFKRHGFVISTIGGLALGAVFISLSMTSSGEMVIDNPVDWVGITSVLDENVTVVDGGSLSIINSTITFECTYEMEFGLRVMAGGSLVIMDADGSNATVGDGSLITGSLPFGLAAEEGSTITVINSVISHCGDSWPLSFPKKGGMEISTDDFVISDVEFMESFAGVYLHQTFGGTIDRCTFRDSTFGVIADRAGDYTIAGCHFENVSTAIYLWSHLGRASSGSISIRECTFENIDDTAIEIHLPLNISILDSIFDHVSYAGVSIEGNDDQMPREVDPNTLIGSNVFKEVGYTGVLLEDIRDVRIDGNEFIDNGNGITLSKVSARDVTITNNTFSGSRVCIDVSVSSSRDILTHHNVFQDSSYGIQGAGSGFVIHNNTFEKMASTAIDVWDGVPEVAHNRFVNNTYGIRAERYLATHHPGLVSDNNTFVGNYFGMSVRDLEPMVLTNDVHSNDVVGLTVLGSEFDTITGIRFVNCTTGVSVISSRGIFVDVRFQTCNQAFKIDMESKVSIMDTDLTSERMDLSASNASVVDLLDTEHRESFVLSGRGTVVRVYWTSTLLVRYASDGRPAVGMECDLETRDGEQHTSHTTDGLGMVGPLKVLQSVWTPAGVTWKIPYLLTVHLPGDRSHTLEVPFTGQHLFEVLIDDVAPVLEIHSPVDGMSFNRSIVGFDLEVSDEHSMVDQLRLDAGGVELYQQLHPVAHLEFEVEVPEGTAKVLLLAVDGWGNEREVELTLIIDTVPPEIMVEQPMNGTETRNASILVRVKVKGGNLARIQGIEVTPDEEGTIQVEAPLASEGENVITILALDEVNNSAVASVIVILDTTPPRLDLVGLPSLTNNPVQLLHGSTDGSGVRLKGMGLDHEGPGDFTFNITLEEGFNELTVEAYDGVGNVATTSVSCVLDTAIEFEFISPINGATVNDTTVQLVASAEPGLVLRMLGETPTDWMERSTPTGFNITLEVPNYGSNYYEFEVRDPAGNTRVLTYGLNRERPPYSVSEDRIDPWVMLAFALFILVICLVALWFRQGVRGDDG